MTKRHPIASILLPKQPNTVAVLSIMMHDGQTIDLNLTRKSAMTLVADLMDKLSRETTHDLVVNT